MRLSSGSASPLETEWNSLIRVNYKTLTPINCMLDSRNPYFIERVIWQTKWKTINDFGGAGGNRGERISEAFLQEKKIERQPPGKKEAIEGGCHFPFFPPTPKIVNCRFITSTQC